MSVLAKKQEVPEPPRSVRDTLSLISKDPALNGGILAMKERKGEFSSPMAAKLSGVAQIPAARKEFDSTLDQMWQRNGNDKLPAASEVIVGAGLHAAIYSAVRVARGFEKPLVLEADKTVGGAFAVSKESAFYLNSRNRPGKLSVPGRDGALNVLPGGMIQPSDLSGDEYQRNTDLAFCIRTTLAMCAHVVPGRKVIGTDKYNAVLDGGDRVPYERLIYATGLGEANMLIGSYADGQRVLTFPQFMGSLDTTFPLRGMKNVAVIGAGDSGRTVIEALCGQGPTSRWSVASLDWPDRIDWFGVPEDSLTRQGYEECNRSRYKGIGRLLDGDIASSRPRSTQRRSRRGTSARTSTSAPMTA
jgi:hypothetical protein